LFGYSELTDCYYGNKTDSELQTNNAWPLSIISVTKALWKKQTYKKIFNRQGLFSDVELARVH